jgi:CelD/BcsL family acetyltransferase involved in cellulose biosynthesis
VDILTRPSTFRIERVDEDRALELLVPDWWKLWESIPAATPFQSPAWLMAWWRSFRPGMLRSVAVFKNGRLVALAPFYLENGGRRLLPIGISLSDYLDVLIDPLYENAVGPALLAHLVQPHEVLCCEELAPDAAALRLWRASGWRAEIRPHNASPVLAPLVIPKTKLRKLRMARHRVARRQGTIECATAATAMDFLRELFRLHGARWEARGEPGVLADDDVRRFLELALPGLAAAGILRLYGLRFGRDMAGVYLGFFRNGSAYAYLGGFDPAFARESPGTVLIGHAIDEAVRDAATEFHFLRGKEEYKYQWGAVDRWNSRLELRRPL